MKVNLNKKEKLYMYHKGSVFRIIVSVDDYGDLDIVKDIIKPDIVNMTKIN